jgi:hypothetical protein
MALLVAAALLLLVADGADETFALLVAVANVTGSPKKSKWTTCC